MFTKGFIIKCFLIVAKFVKKNSDQVEIKMIMKFVTMELGKELLNNIYLINIGLFNAHFAVVDIIEIVN
jgi:uncharacterized membrane protein YiaA